MKGRAGFTLVEVLIAVFLGSIMLTAVYRLMAGGARIFHAVQAHSEAQDQAEVALTRLATDLRESSWPTVTITASTISFAPASGPAGTFIVYRLDGTNTLWRGTVSGIATTRMNPVQLPPQPVAIAHNVKSFTLSPATFPSNTAITGAVHANLAIGADTASVAAWPRN